MARNEEKAQSMLHRYLRTRAGEDGQTQLNRGHQQRRPYLATLCEDVDEAQRWHRQVLREISRKVSEIQNGMGMVQLWRKFDVRAAQNTVLVHSLSRYKLIPPDHN
jgi:Isy1-like splicing family